MNGLFFVFLLIQGRQKIMENKNIASDGIDWGAYDSFKCHRQSVK